MTIIIVDDDTLICRSLSITLSKEIDIQVVGTADNGEKAVKLCEQLSPDIVLMDIRMPKMDGIQSARIIKNNFPKIRIMMLTTFQDKPSIETALTSGADEYLLKTDRISDIANKLRLLTQNTAILDLEVLKTLTSSSTASLNLLTPREKDVLKLLVHGLSNREIAAHLFLSEGTVRNILSVIMSKMDVKNRSQLILAAMEK